jgi:hypothetical protein
MKGVRHLYKHLNGKGQYSFLIGDDQKIGYSFFLQSGGVRFPNNMRCGKNGCFENGVLKTSRRASRSKP